MDSKKINRTRNNKITVYLSDAELERLNSKVDRTLLNREQFIRNMIEELTIVEAPPAPLWQTVIMMKDATNSLKEISDRCFLSGKVDEDMLLNTIEDLQTCVEDVTSLCFPEENNENRPYRAVSDRER